MNDMNLPQPDSLAQRNSEQLKAYIRNEIKKSNGLISFAHFMDLALYYPGMGYYSAGTHKLGKEGDFTTSPEISPLFAKTIARQCQSILSVIENASLLEVGAGSGVFASDLLLELGRLHSLPAHYYILEVSADLRDRQQKLLQERCPDFVSRVVWLNELPTLFSGMILGNELIDAIPAYCFQIHEGEALERCVGLEGENFCWKLRKPECSTLTQHLISLQDKFHFPEGYTSEINLQMTAWIHSIYHSMKEGVVLLFDYGYGEKEYYHRDRTEGTLMCYYKHRRHSNPFKWVGLQDITTHVNFTFLIESALEAGFLLNGYTTQAAFLLNSGLLDIASETPSSSEREKFSFNQEIKRLTHPSELGEAIKVVALSKYCEGNLEGFARYDRRKDL